MLRFYWELCLSTIYSGEYSRGTGYEIDIPILSSSAVLNSSLSSEDLIVSFKLLLKDGSTVSLGWKESDASELLWGYSLLFSKSGLYFLPV